MPVRLLILLIAVTWQLEAEAADNFVRRKVPTGTQKLIDAGQFSLDGQTLTVAGEQGLLQSFDVTTLKLSNEHNLRGACTEFAQWQNGFVVVNGATQELIVLDQVLTELRRVSVPGIVRFTTGPP